MVIRVAYAVPDLAAGMCWRTDELGVGPWSVNWSSAAGLHLLR
ncbi:hypothetical protein [Streptomyces sp. NPDC101776]